MSQKGMMTLHPTSKSSQVQLLVDTPSASFLIRGGQIPHPTRERVRERASQPGNPGTRFEELLFHKASISFDAYIRVSEKSVIHDHSELLPNVHVDEPRATQERDAYFDERAAPTGMA